MNCLLIPKNELKYNIRHSMITFTIEVTATVIQYIALGYVPRKYEFSNFWSPIY